MYTTFELVFNSKTMFHYLEKLDKIHYIGP